MFRSSVSRRAFARGCLLGGAAVVLNRPVRGAEAPPARPVSRGPLHHFFGYYDKCPWNASGRYLLAHQSGFCDRQPNPGEAVRVGLIDTHDGDRFLPLDRTAAWSWQQGAMLQWLGANPDRQIIYNTFDGTDYRATIRDIETNQARTLPKPIYAVSGDGTQAVTLPFDRLNRLRPGYGYMARPERAADDPAPADDGIGWMNVSNGDHRLIIPLARLATNQPDARFSGAQHWVNHLQFNPSGSWFTFLHRWKAPEARGWQTRMYVARPDGSDLRLIWDHGMVSHFDWRDDHTLLAWVRTAEGANAFALRDIHTGATSVLGAGVLTQDGHCSYSPDRNWALTDTYPDRDRLQHLMLFHPATNRTIGLGAFFEPPNLTGPFRCDLHPRWDRQGKQVCFDSTHRDGQRQIYVVNVAAIVGLAPGS